MIVLYNNKAYNKSGEFIRNNRLFYTLDVPSQQIKTNEYINFNGEKITEKNLINFIKKVNVPACYCKEA